MKAQSRLGKYLLLERMNVGAIAEVFVAKSLGVEGFERIVALKKILPAVAADQDFIASFLDEARISVQLSHANIVHVLEFGKEEDTYFIAMEYVSGRDLRRVLDYYVRRGERMPVAQAVFIASRICEGLDYAHRRRDARGAELNIVHRGVSPQNVLVAFEGEVKLIDFGMAKAANRSLTTQVGILKGKAGYMSPEQIRARTIDRRSDLFAVAALLYEALAGAPLFQADSDMATLEKVAKAEVPPLRDRNPYVPDGLEDVVLKALSLDPESRYQWASDLQDDLARYLVSDESVYSGKRLGAFMRHAFAEDLQSEAERLSRFAQAQPEFVRGVGQRRTNPALVPPPARTRGPELTPFDWVNEDTQLTVDRTVVQTLAGLEDAIAHDRLVETTQVVDIESIARPPSAPTEPKVVVHQAERRPGVPKPVRLAPKLVTRNGETLQVADPSEDTNPELNREKILGGIESVENANARAPRTVVPRSRGGALRMWAAAALVAAVILGIGTVLLWRSRDPGSGILVKVMPAHAHAEVTVGGRLVTSERVMRFPPGEYDLIAVAPGYRMHSQRITIFKNDPEAVFTVFLEPEPLKLDSDKGPDRTAASVEPAEGSPHNAPGATFSARFVSAQAGVEIAIEGRTIGQTPDAHVEGLAVGKSYPFVAKRSGFKSQQGTVSSTGESEVNVPIALESDRVSAVRRVRSVGKKAYGKVVCSSNPAGAEVFVDGKPVGRRTPITSSNPLELPVGKRKIVFQIGGLESAVQVVEVREHAVSALKDVAIDREHDLF